MRVAARIGSNTSKDVGWLWAARVHLLRKSNLPSNVNANASGMQCFMRMLSLYGAPGNRRRAGRGDFDTFQVAVLIARQLFFKLAGPCDR